MLGGSCFLVVWYLDLHPTRYLRLFEQQPRLPMIIIYSIHACVTRSIWYCGSERVWKGGISWYKKTLFKCNAKTCKNVDQNQQWEKRKQGKQLQGFVLSNRRTRENLLDTIWLDICKKRGWNDQMNSDRFCFELSRSISTEAGGWKKERMPVHASASECWDICTGYCKEELTYSNNLISKDLEPLNLLLFMSQKIAKNLKTLKT